MLGDFDAIEAVAIVGSSWMGPNPCLCFIAGVGDAATAALMDDLRTLIPADHPKGPEAAEVFGYLPLGCAAYEMAADKKPLPSGETNFFYCPRETLEMMAEWE